MESPPPIALQRNDVFTSPQIPEPARVKSVIWTGTHFEIEAVGLTTNQYYERTFTPAEIAVRAGFAEAWKGRDYAIIVRVGGRLPNDVLHTDPKGQVGGYARLQLTPDLPDVTYSNQTQAVCLVLNDLDEIVHSSTLGLSGAFAAYRIWLEQPQGAAQLAKHIEQLFSLGYTDT